MGRAYKLFEEGLLVGDYTIVLWYFLCRLPKKLFVKVQQKAAEMQKCNYQPHCCHGLQNVWL